MSFYEEPRKINMKIVAVISAVVGLCFLGSVLAVAYLQSNSVGPYNIASPTPSPTPTPTPVVVTLSITPVPGDYYSGQTLTLRIMLADSASGKIVTFYNQNQDVVGVATSTNGEALLTITPPVGTWTYHAIVQ